jgi:nitroreductase
MPVNDTLSRANYAAWNIELLHEEVIDRGALLRHLVGWAVLAASSHNVQPWKFILKPRENIIDACIDPVGILPASDVKGRQAYISLGCAIQNLLSAAAYYGLSYTLEYNGETRYPLSVVTVHFHDLESPHRGDPKLLDAIKQRRMNRAKYDPERPVPEEVLSKMNACAVAGGVTLCTVKDAGTRFAIAEFQYLADRAVVAITKFRTELGDFLLPNDTTSEKGMPGNTFGLSDALAKYVHEELKKPGAFDPDLAVGFASSSRDGIRSAPMLGVLTVPEDTAEWWIKAGMVFQEIALIAEEAKLAVAVHAALVEVGMFNRLLGLRLGSTERPTVIFRVGYATEERPHSPRMPTEAVCAEE